MKNRNLDCKDDWMTPPEYYNRWNVQYHFDFDPCPLNHDLSLWDGLNVQWGNMNYVNPPYSRELKEAFVLKALEESREGRISFMLLPVSTSTKLYHDVIRPNATSVEMLKGRIPFIGVNDKGQLVNHHLIGEITDEVFELNGKVYPRYVRNSGQHDSMTVLFTGKSKKYYIMEVLNKYKFGHDDGFGGFNYGVDEDSFYAVTDQILNILP